MGPYHLSTILVIASRWQLGPRNLINAHFKKCGEREPTTTSKGKRRPRIKHDPRFATCRYGSCLRHVFAQKSSSANGRCKKIFWDTQRSDDSDCVIVVVHKLNTVAEISPKTHARTHTYTLRAPLIFTLYQFKGGAWKVDVTLRRLKRRTRTRHRWPPL